MSKIDSDGRNKNGQPGKKGFSRRSFLGAGVAGGAVATLPSSAEAAQAAAGGRVLGPGPIPVALRINGKVHNLKIEPRVTLLDAMRNHGPDLTGAKKVCDRATCGACTVILAGRPVYSCSVLAVEAQGKDIQTIEGLGTPEKMHPVQKAFVENDAQQCGFCTPGFVMAVKAFLDKHASPTMDDVKKGLGGNLCRCGTYVGVRQAALDASRELKEEDVPNKYDWPPAEKRSLIGKRISRLDGPAKSTGAAKYSYDVNRPGGLVAKLLMSPHAHAKVVKIDTSEAERLPGVRAVRVMAPAGTELNWQGTEVAVVAADTEEIARDGVRKIKVDYEVLPHLVQEEDLNKAGGFTKPSAEQSQGNVDQAFAASDVVVTEGYYGIRTITHCCLEPHGQVIEWEGDNCTIHASTQAVSRVGGDLAKVLGAEPATANIKPANIRVLTQHMGGGFGSKFSIDRWGIECAKLSKQTGKAVKLMLDRDGELLMAGARPSDYAKIKVAAKKDGSVVGWQSESWSTGGMTGGGMPPIPYVFTEIPNRRMRHIAVSTHTGPQRAWRAPNHQQAAVLTMGALEDMAAKLGMNPLDFFMKNASLTPRGDVYRAELAKAAELIDWKAKWHPPGKGSGGHIKHGVGISLHTWGGRPHDSDCKVIINSDGSVQAQLASQDLGVGTRGVIAIVAAETLGLPLSGVQVQIGDSNYPVSGASGGSTTVGGVSASTRRASVKALDKLFEAVAPGLGTTADKLVAVDGRIQVAGDSSKSLTWKAACAKLGTRKIEEIGRQPAKEEGNLNDQGVGGVQMSEVEVDTETGIVAVKKTVAVQDCGLIINLKTAESQVFGSVIMGICSALYEERIYDQQSGKMLNADMEFYKLSGAGDIGEIVVHMMTGVYDGRGVIGLGEPPAISPPAAIYNAVANALGVRVTTVPMTPDKVLAALGQGGRA